MLEAEQLGESGPNHARRLAPGARADELRPGPATPLTAPPPPSRPPSSPPPILATHLTSHPLTLLDTAFVVIFFLFPAEVGASVQYRAGAKVRRIEQIKLEERQQLAASSTTRWRTTSRRLRCGLGPAGCRPRPTPHLRLRHCG